MTSNGGAHVDREGLRGTVVTMLPEQRDALVALCEPHGGGKAVVLLGAFCQYSGRRTTQMDSPAGSTGGAAPHFVHQSRILRVAISRSMQRCIRKLRTEDRSTRLVIRSVDPVAVLERSRRVTKMIQRHLEAMPQSSRGKERRERTYVEEQRVIARRFAPPHGRQVFCGSESKRRGERAQYERRKREQQEVGFHSWEGGSTATAPCPSTPWSFIRRARLHDSKIRSTYGHWVRDGEQLLTEAKQRSRYRVPGGKRGRRRTLGLSDDSAPAKRVLKRNYIRRRTCRTCSTSTRSVCEGVSASRQIRIGQLDVAHQDAQRES